MDYHKNLEIFEKRVTSEGVKNEWKVYCGSELIGIVTEYNTTGIYASCSFSTTVGMPRVNSLKEGVKFIEEELEVFIANIIRENI